MGLYGNFLVFSHFCFQSIFVDTSLFVSQQTSIQLLMFGFKLTFCNLIMWVRVHYVHCKFWKLMQVMHIKVFWDRRSNSAFLENVMDLFHVSVTARNMRPQTSSKNCRTNCSPSACRRVEIRLGKRVLNPSTEVDGWNRQKKRNKCKESEGSGE